MKRKNSRQAAKEKVDACVKEIDALRQELTGLALGTDVATAQEAILKLFWEAYYFTMRLRWLLNHHPSLRDVLKEETFCPYVFSADAGQRENDLNRFIEEMNEWKFAQFTDKRPKGKPATSERNCAVQKAIRKLHAHLNHGSASDKTYGLEILAAIKRPHKQANPQKNKRTKILLRGVNAKEVRSVARTLPPLTAERDALGAWCLAVEWYLLASQMRQTDEVIFKDYDVEHKPLRFDDHDLRETRKLIKSVLQATIRQSEKAGE